MILLDALVLMLPAYLSSPGAVLSRGKRPIDMGKNFTDGRRILGDGKTFEGLIIGTLIGFTAGAVVEFFSTKNTYGSYANIFLLSLGGLIGDLANSFLKRRLRVDRGGKLPLLDQLNLVFGAWFLCILFSRGWFLENFNWKIVLIVIIVTPILHRGANLLAYGLRLKEVPW